MPNVIRQHVHLYCRAVDPHLPQAAPSVTTVSSGAAPTNLAADVQAGRFEMSFEQAFERLELLPRMFIELDGSFVWSGQQAGRAWQIDGMLYDHNGRLQRVELTGHAPRHHWEQLLNAFGQPLDTFTIHCLQHQRFIDTAEFLAREL